MRVRLLTTLVGALLLGATLAWAGEAGKHPLENAKSGQWTFHRSVAQSGDSQSETYIYKWIDKVESRKVSIEIQPVGADGKFALAAPSLTIVDLDKPPDAREIAAATTEEDLVTVKGRKLHCKKIESVSESPRGKITTTRWVSDEVPIFGNVRAITLDKDGKEMSRVELIDFGDRGGAEKPLAPSRDDGAGPVKHD